MNCGSCSPTYFRESEARTRHSRRFGKFVRLLGWMFATLANRDVEAEHTSRNEKTAGAQAGGFPLVSFEPSDCYSEAQGK